MQTVNILPWPLLIFDKGFGFRRELSVYGLSAFGPSQWRLHSSQWSFRKIGTIGTLAS